MTDAIDPSTLRDGDKIGHSTAAIADEIAEGRRKAHAKHGDTSIEGSGNDFEFLAILTEEVGEVAEALNDHRHDPAYPLLTNLRAELVDVATVAVAWAAAIDTRLPAAPEPAPIEVGDWWKSATGIVAVVLGVDGDTLTWRRLDGSLPLAGRTHVMAESWTRLDGPPEPPVGSVYVITNVDGQPDVWHHHANGLHYCAGSSVGMPWADACSFYTRDLLATLQIVHTLGVE